MVRGMNWDLVIGLTGIAGAAGAWAQALDAKKKSQEANDIARRAAKTNETQARLLQVEKAARRNELYLERSGDNAFRVTNGLDYELDELRVECAGALHPIVIERDVQPEAEIVFRLKGTPNVFCDVTLKWASPKGNHVQKVEASRIWTHLRQ